MTVLGALLGFNIVAVKIAMRDADPLTIQAFATVVGALVMLAGTAILGPRRLPDRRLTRAAIAVSLVMTVAASVGLSFGVQRVDAGLAALIMSVTPIMTLALSVLVLRERRSWHGTAGMAFGLVGVAIVSVGAGLRGGTDEAWGTLLLLGGALGWSSGLIIMRTIGHGLPAVLLTAWQMTIGAPILVAITLLTTGITVTWTWTLVACLLYMGLLAKGLGTLLQLYTLRIGSPVHASLTAFLMPIFGALGGIVFLGETLERSEVVGAVAILVGIALVLRARGGGPEAGAPPR